MMRVLGIDPGLLCTGWGVIAVDGARLQHIANGAIQPKPNLDDASRLQIIFDGLCEVITLHQPDQAGIEQIFVSKSAGSALRLGMARGVAILACGVNRLGVGEISARAVKKAVTGTGTADKKQIQDMVTRLLAVTAQNADAADALAIAIAASNEAGTAASVGVELGKGQAAKGQAAKGQAAKGQAAKGQAAKGQAAKGQANGGLSAAISAALARDDAGNGGNT